MNEGGKLSWKTTPNLQLIRDGKATSQILRIERIDDVGDGIFYRLTTATLEDPHKMRKFSIKGNKDILEEGWKAKPVAKVLSDFKLRNDVTKLLPKLPHYLASLFGGATVVEKEYDYDKDGKIASTGRGVTNIINRLDKNPLVRNRNVLEWDRSNLPTFTVQVVS